MFKKLHLSNFRNYIDARLSLDDKRNIVVLYGENGEGKTNVLEAISTFSETSGLRKASREDMINKDSVNDFWNVAIETEDAEFSSGYLMGKESGKRVYKVGDKRVRNLSEFRDNNYLLWMTYETDRLFASAPSDRREFIDMLCCVKDKSHNVLVRSYERLTKERLKILKLNLGKPILADTAKWLDIIEAKIADLGLKIADNRIIVSRELEKFQLRNGEFPEFKNQMTGSLEKSIIEKEVDFRLESYKSELKDRRQKDGFAGSTTFGPNRSDWKVIHVEKQIAAELCSAGEQKMLLSGAFLAFVVRNLKYDERNLILLLDDVSAHLDSRHRALIFKYVRSLVAQNLNKISVWLSGTDKTFFDELKEDAFFFNVHDNLIERG
ncbi:MAG: AAA family ATPase [Holosporales bacterium]|jgi:DNA replication and repair protein RecF|nr:AAA family ATPase [Holosporales bacterium]